MKPRVLLRLFTRFGLLTLALPSYSAIIFTNMPGNVFGPAPVGVGAIPVPGVFIAAATNFTPAASYELASFLLPLAVVSGPGTLDVSLYADTGDKPGNLIETITLSGFPVAGPLGLVTAAPASNPILSSGSQYWVAVTGGTPATFGVWGLTPFAGDPTAGGASRSIVNGVDQGWIRNTGTIVGAVQVEGTLIPEPSSLMLTGAALAGAALANAWVGRLQR